MIYLDADGFPGLKIETGRTNAASLDRRQLVHVKIRRFHRTNLPRWGYDVNFGFGRARHDYGSARSMVTDLRYWWQDTNDLRGFLHIGVLTADELEEFRQFMILLRGLS